MFFFQPQFFIFFSVFFLIYWRLPAPAKNSALTAASLLFYTLWDWRTLPILTGSLITTWIVTSSIRPEASPLTKKKYLTLSIVFNLAVLALFKYTHFFLDNGFYLLRSIGLLHQTPHFFNILMPLGISFFTFKSISYSVDLYRGAVAQPCKLKDFILYTSFFPQIISGPIDPAARFLPQITSPKTLTLESFNQACFLIGWGLFQKLFAADNLAVFVDAIFSQSRALTPHEARSVLYLYAFQLYFDFNGYSQMAWGFAKLLGYDTTHNFNAPFFALNIQQFWNRWHISLSSWIRDYLYTPLFIAFAGRNTKLRLCAATLLSMFCVGLWHGAGWTFIAYGLYHGILLTLYALIRPQLQKLLKPKSQAAAFFWSAFSMFLTFHLVAVGFLIFRSPNLQQFYLIMKALVSPAFFFIQPASLLIDFFFYAGLVIVLEIFQTVRASRWAAFEWHPAIRTCFYILCFFLLTLHRTTSAKDYIYFQF